MILHHYELSPFSEKIRLMFGYCDLQWQSVISPAMPPRPAVDPLAGGYRRIPAMQIGADIFCDTKLITSEIAFFCDKPELAIDTCSDEIRDYSHYIDTTIFIAGIQSVDTLQSLFAVFKLFSPLEGLKFIIDRAIVLKESSLDVLSKKQAIAILEAHFNDMESKLKRSHFLFGERPSIADFSAYHILWFKKKTVGGEKLDSYENIRRWLQDMSEFGHGQRQESSLTGAFDAAKTTTPRAIPKSMIVAQDIGKQVEVRPSDYAKDSVIGTLVAEDERCWIVSRETLEFGTVHVHFPRQGFEMSVL